MIKAEEIRIGNWFHHKEADFQWSLIDWPSIEECNLWFEDIEPITLTQEWLLKFGFELHDRIVYYNNGGDFRLIGQFEDETLVIKFQALAQKLEIRTVHHLQNWFYFNTGCQELEIKPSTP